MITQDYKEELLNRVINIVHQASEKIMEFYFKPINVYFKEDESPITAADKEAHYHIFSKLQDLTPNLPIVSEEGKIRHIKGSEFWLVDPLDGTKEFIQRNDEFTVNIALIKNTLPVFGIVCAPALNLTYAGIVGNRAFKITSTGKSTPIKVRHDIRKDVIIVGSRNHSDVSREEQFLSLFPGNSLIKVGSSLKFCKIAEGTADIYPRFGRTMEWDSAAGQAVLMAAGGFVHSMAGNTLTYGKKNWENPSFIAAASIDFLKEGRYGN